MNVTYDDLQKRLRRLKLATREIGTVDYEIFNPTSYDVVNNEMWFCGDIYKVADKIDSNIFAIEKAGGSYIKLSTDDGNFTNIKFTAIYNLKDPDDFKLLMRKSTSIWFIQDNYSSIRLWYYRLIRRFREMWNGDI